MSNLTVRGMFSNLFDDTATRHERRANVRVCWRCGYEGGSNSVSRAPGVPNGPMFCKDKLDCYSRKCAAKARAQNPPPVE